MQLHKISLSLIALLLATDTSMAASDGAAGGAGRARRRTSSLDREAVAAAMAASLARTKSEEDLAAAIAASEADAARPRTPDVGYGAPSGRGRSESPSTREAMEASRITAAQEEAARAHRAALGGRRDVTVAAGVESRHSSDNWSNPTYIRDHLDALVADKAAYGAILFLHATTDERRTVKLRLIEQMKEKERGFHTLGYKEAMKVKTQKLSEADERRAILEYVIEKLERTGGGGAAARY